MLFHFKMNTVHNEIFNFVNNFWDMKSRKEKKRSWGREQTLWKDLEFS